jgi:hypothetical protein
VNDDRFEAALWQLLAAHRVTVPEAVRFVDAVKAAASRIYQEDTPAKQRARREVLARRKPEPVTDQTWIRL